MLKATIETSGITVGEPDPNDNEFRLVVTGLDAGAAPLDFYLTGTFGPDARDLFLDRKDADKCKLTLPNGWKKLWTVAGAGAFNLRLFTREPRADTTLTFTFRKITSQTAAGDASLTFRAGADTQNLSVPKNLPKQPGIIAFYSDPPEGTQNLPDRMVTLHWLTSGLTDVELSLASHPAAVGISAEHREEGSQEIKVGSQTELATLSGRGGSKTVKSIRIEVRRRGWYDRTLGIMQGDPAFPKDAHGLNLEPTEIINANDSCLYAMFRHVSGKSAMLFKADDPFAGWDLVKSTLPGQEDQEGHIPDGFSESPGVYWEDSIWLIGGSQIDPDPGCTSSLVWRLDLNSASPTWKNLGPAPWSERMGHAVLVFNEEIWMMGGRDEAGNALNDVWRLKDPDPSSKWEPVAEHAGWAPRCLIRPTVWKGDIWLYGGVTEPFSSVVYDDLWVYSMSARRWDQKLQMASINKHGKPISSCLQVFRDKIHLFGSFRKIDPTDFSEEVKPGAWSLNDGSWMAFSNEGFEGWGSSTTFSYQVINFRNTCLIAKALNYRQKNEVLKVFVGGIE